MLDSQITEEPSMPTKNTRDDSNQSRPGNRGGRQQGRGFADMENNEQGKIVRTGGEAVSGDKPKAADRGVDARRNRPESRKHDEKPAWLSANDRDEQDVNSGGHQ